jgi:hypothetical protein
MAAEWTGALRKVYVLLQGLNRNSGPGISNIQLPRGTIVQTWQRFQLQMQVASHKYTSALILTSTK